MTDAISEIVSRAVHFKEDAIDILSSQEGSRSRAISLDRTRKRIDGLSLQQDELFRQALICVQLGVHRAAHVIAWAAFIDFLERELASDNLQKVKQAKPGWALYRSVEDLRENVPEFQIIEAAREVGLLSKQETKAIQGLLAKRNECAHPSRYQPTLNESLGFVSELLTRIERIRSKPA